MKTCAFTGHRNLKGLDFDEQLLERVVEDLALNGVKKFLCGMAAGFDLIAAQAVLNVKDKYGAELVACLPCGEQNKYFSASNKEKYESILSKCDDVVMLGDSYSRDCMLRRDRYLVDNSDVLVCFLRRRRGGTFYTVNYAKKCGRKTIEL